MITLDKVSFTYKDQAEPTLENVTLSIEKGSCVLITGKSGCGKTTLIRLMNGLAPKFFEGELTGRVFIDGTDVKEKQTYDMAQLVGSVFQNPRNQFFCMDGESELAFGLENLGTHVHTMIDRIDEVQRIFDMEKLLYKSVFELSGGEKQKIAIGSAYGLKPSIFVLDEPSANLDLVSTKRLKGILMQLKELGKTIVIVEHSLFYLNDLVDQVILMEQGQVAEQMTFDQLLGRTDQWRHEKGLRCFEAFTTNDHVKQQPITQHDDVPYVMAKGIRLCYKKNPVCHSIDLQAYKGEIIAITGENGAGKSTFARMICGLHDSYEGQLLIGGKRLNKKQRLRQSYMVMQDVNFQLFADSLMEECRLEKETQPDDVIEQVLDDLSLLPYKDQHPISLSGGQKQRAAVAISLLSNCDILVFDEPTSGLDYDGMCRVSQLLKQLADKGKLIFVVTHDFELIHQACHREVVVRGIV